MGQYKPCTYTMEPDVVRELQRIARRNHRTLSAEVRLATRRYVEAHRKLENRRRASK